MADDEQDDRERKDGGAFASKHGITKDDVFEAMEPHEPYSTGEISDLVDIPQRTAFKYLDSLADSGRIQKKKQSATYVVWYRTK